MGAWNKLFTADRLGPQRKDAKAQRVLTTDKHRCTRIVLERKRHGAESAALLSENNGRDPGTAFECGVRN